MKALKAEQKYNNFISPSSKSYFIQHESNEIFQVKVLRTNEELAKGFSGILPEQVSPHQGLFFMFEKKEKKFFWMPNTYFDLTIIYLDENLKVLEIIRKAPHHIGYSENNGLIFRAPPIFARHVLEIQASSPMGEKIQVGSQFSWVKNSPPGFQQK